jgi:hypothetical protein
MKLRMGKYKIAFNYANEYYEVKNTFYTSSGGSYVKFDSICP